MKEKSDFKERQNEINKKIEKRDFSQIYLFYGTQAYLRNQNRDKILKALLGENFAEESNMNLNRFSGSGAEVRSILDYAGTLPFFADRRVVFLENTGLLEKSDPDGELLAEELPHFPETTVLVISEEKVDKRKKLYKQINSGKCKSTVLDCDTVTMKDLEAWTATLFRTAGTGISRNALNLFMQYAGTDMLEIRSEAEKLIAYSYGRNAILAEEDIKKICSPRLNDRIFDMIEAIAQKKTDTALDIYMDLCSLQTPPQVVLSLMQRQFNQLLQCGELMNRRVSDAEIAQILKVPSFVVSGKYRPCLQKYSKADLIRAIDACVQSDLDYKSGKIAPGIAVEMILIQTVSGTAPGK